MPNTLLDPPFPQDDPEDEPGETVLFWPEDVPQENRYRFAEAVATLKATVEIKQFATDVMIVAEDYSLHPAERCQKIAQLAEGVLAE